MRRLLVALVASLLLIGLVAPAAGAGPVVRAAAVVPKVVFIVGPAGAATERYRVQARAAATLARTFTPDVTELYSPNATWPAVKAALQGASLVIYMGHGNGWPSRYRDSLYPATQNGFGLNPAPGGNDATHQYFGEARIAGSIKLADNAVVLLNHLCYASGNTEPGLPEGTVEQARQRVDNFAAGFIRAGAAAVVAEAYASPSYMVRAVLGTAQSIEAAWRNAPSRNGNAVAFESVRSPGYLAEMDPESPTAGFTRSIVLKAGLASADVRRGARGSAASGGLQALPAAPSLAAAGITAEAPSLAATTAGSRITYKVPYQVAHRSALPRSIMASVRWDALDPPAVDPVAQAAAAGAASVADSDAGLDLGLVTAERLGDVVAPVKVKLARTSLSFKVETPAAPGRYRLTVTLHDADGVAFDAATQALLPTLIVRVTGDLDAAVLAPATAEVTHGDTTTLPVWVANLGVAPWGQAGFEDPFDPTGSLPAAPARLTGQWVALDGTDEQIASAAAASASPVDLPIGLAHGVTVKADLALFAPTVPGEYLLVLDIVTPDHGSLIASGVEATTVRVHVVEAPTAPATAAPVAPSPSAPATVPSPAP